MSLSRRYLLAGASGLVVAAQPGAAAAQPGPVTMAAGCVSAADLGIAPGNSAESNRANLVAALSGASMCVFFPPGDYRVDNSGWGVVITDFGGELLMQPGARLLFTDGTSRGVIFDGGTGARLRGLSTAFVTRPAARVNAAECVLFQNCTEPTVEDAHIDGSAAAGLLFWQCVRPTVRDAVITATMADGLHFANCQDGRADRVTTMDTGDDGVSFVNYASGPAHTGGLATDLRVTNSRSRGVAVVGHSGVTVRDARVDNTTGHGLYCAYEQSWNTRVPTGVRFERCEVTSAGRYEPPAGTNNSGVRVDRAGTVSIAAVTVDRPMMHGFWASNGGAAGQVTLTDFAASNPSGYGVVVEGTTCRLDRITVDKTGSTGVFASSCPRVEYGSIAIHNASTANGARRAAAFDGNAVVGGGLLFVHDVQATPTGYTVATLGTQVGTLGTVIDAVTNGAVLVDNRSGLAYLLR